MVKVNGSTGYMKCTAKAEEGGKEVESALAAKTAVNREGYFSRATVKVDSGGRTLSK